MKGLKLMVLTAMATLVLASAVWAVEPALSSQPGESGRPAPRMQCMDRFDAMDANHDGAVTHDEFMAVRHPRGRTDDVFRAKDLNGDGVLSKEEFCTGKGMGKAKGKMQQ